MAIYINYYIEYRLGLVVLSQTANDNSFSRDYGIANLSDDQICFVNDNNQLIC